jgi:hypothetical protein
MFTMRRIGLCSIFVVVAAIGAATFVERGWACPFCSAVSLTFGEEINTAQVAVIARLVKTPPPVEGAAAQTSSLEVTKTKFDIVKVLKGEEALGKTRTIEVAYFGESPAGATFLVMGIDPPTINWGTPIAISERGQEYVIKGMELPKEGSDRLAFFQDYLEDADEMLARDAYDEFAKAPYAMVLGLKDRIKHDKIVEWSKSTKIPVSRRRLYMTMLGACGTQADLPMLEEMIRSKERQTKGALDALVAAYLTLKGPEGMPLVEDLFLKNKDAEYTDTYSTIMALRFHGTEEKIIPRERLTQGMRTMLDRPQLADLVIPDLARWQDWSVIDRLADLFKQADDESSWVRVPVINYLRACPLPEAKVRLEELAQIDPEAVKRASAFFPLAAAAASTTDKQAAADKPVTAGQAKPNPAAFVKDDAAQSTNNSVPLSEPATRSAASAPGNVAPVGIAVPSNWPVLGGLAAAAVLLACAFWAILKGGQQPVR